MATLEADVANICDRLVSMEGKLDAALATKADRTDVERQVNLAHATAKDAVIAAEAAAAAAERRLPIWVTLVFAAAGTTIGSLITALAAIIASHHL